MTKDMSLFALWLFVIGLGVNAKHSKEKLHNLTEDIFEEAWDVLEQAVRLGLRVSEHTVHTEDGYVLRVFRLHGTSTKAGPPVLLMHGLLQSAAVWLDAGNASLAWLLTTSGYDLWLGNARGSHYSRRHAWLRSDIHSLYWRFSGDEVGRFDLPALIDYILNTTGYRKLSYIGFSQGGGTFYIMCSERPQYCDKVNLMIGLAPATRMMHTTSVPFRFVTEYYKYNEDRLFKHGIWEVLPQGSFVQKIFKNLCNLSDAAAEICLAMKDVLDGSNPGSITAATSRAAAVSSLSGTSVHNMAWYGQLVNSKHFRKFDYGADQNLLHYGSEAAPVYNFSAVTVPAVVIYGRNDGIVDARDVKWSVRKLPNVKKVVEVQDPLWTHFDFSFSKNIPQYLFPEIEKALNGTV